VLQVVEELETGTRRINLDRSVLAGMLTRIGLSDMAACDGRNQEASFAGLGTSPDARVAPITPAGEALLRAVVETVAEVEGAPLMT